MEQQGSILRWQQKLPGALYHNELHSWAGLHLVSLDLVAGGMLQPCVLQLSLNCLPWPLPISINML